MRSILAILLLGCASAPKKVDWTTTDAVAKEAHWRTNHCAEPNSAKCDALWLVREELEAIIQATRAQFEAEHKRACEP